jgi:hypothetical protein
VAMIFLTLTAVALLAAVLIGLFAIAISAR